MLINNDGRIAGDVTGDFFLPLFIDEASETSNIDIMPRSHVALHYIKKCFYRGGDICFIDTCFVGNLIDYVSFGHGDIGLRVLLIRERKFISSCFKSKINLLTINKVGDGRAITSQFIR
jgi:hypothetical protein